MSCMHVMSRVSESAPRRVAARLCWRYVTPATDGVEYQVPTIRGPLVAMRLRFAAQPC